MLFWLSILFWYAILAGLIWLDLQVIRLLIREITQWDS